MATDVISDVASRSRSLVGGDGVFDHPADLVSYERDASLFECASPRLVVLPRTADEALEVVRICNSAKVVLVARGAGTGRVGGCLSDGGVVLGTSRMRGIDDVNTEQSYAVVEAGVVLDQLNARLRTTGRVFSPDPFSSISCTIGGCIAANARGPRSLKYGDTRAQVLGLEMVLWEGRLVRLGMAAEHDECRDLLSSAIGGEGAQGLITKAWLKLVPPPSVREALVALFETVGDAVDLASSVADGEPSVAAIELLDRTALDSLEPVFRCRFPKTAQAMLLIEVDGDQAVTTRGGIAQLCKRAKAREVREPRGIRDLETYWAWRQRCPATLQRLAPTCWIQDVFVPRERIGDAIAQFTASAQRHEITMALIAHVGDGYLHPVLLFDATLPDQKQRATLVRDEIFAASLSCGGNIRGEHGLGREKPKKPTVEAAALS